jgi:hypothetical protein
VLADQQEGYPAVGAVLNGTWSLGVKNGLTITGPNAVVFPNFPAGPDGKRIVEVDAYAGTAHVARPTVEVRRGTVTIVQLYPDPAPF